MKKKFLITGLATLAFIFALAFDSHAQFKFGLKGGYNIASIGGLDKTAGVKSVKSLGGFTAGAFFQVKIPIISIQLDALYSQQGTKWTDSNNGDHTYENNYLNLPAVAKLHLGPINLQAGVQYGILLNSTIDGVKDDNHVFFTKNDLSIPVGIGVDISKLMLEARYNIGVANINNFTSDTYANGVVQLTAGIKF